MAAGKSSRWCSWFVIKAGISAVTAAAGGAVGGAVNYGVSYFSPASRAAGPVPSGVLSAATAFVMDALEQAEALIGEKLSINEKAPCTMVLFKLVSFLTRVGVSALTAALVEHLAVPGETTADLGQDYGAFLATIVAGLAARGLVSSCCPERGRTAIGARALAMTGIGTAAIGGVDGSYLGGLAEAGSLAVAVALKEMIDRIIVTTGVEEALGHLRTASSAADLSGSRSDRVASMSGEALRNPLMTAMAAARGGAAAAPYGTTVPAP